MWFSIGADVDLVKPRFGLAGDGSRERLVDPPRWPAGNMPHGQGVRAADGVAVLAA
jgi:hypothetical protein